MDESESFKPKIKITGKTHNNGNEKDVQIMVPLINCEVNLILTWSSTCVITVCNGAGIFAITDA